MVPFTLLQNAHIFQQVARAYVKWKKIYNINGKRMWHCVLSNVHALGELGLLELHRRHKYQSPGFPNPYKIKKKVFKLTSTMMPNIVHGLITSFYIIKRMWSKRNSQTGSPLHPKNLYSAQFMPDDGIQKCQ